MEIMLLATSVFILPVIAGVMLLLQISRNASRLTQMANLRQDIARLDREIERLHNEVDQLKRPKTAGSTDIRSAQS